MRSSITPLTAIRLPPIYTRTPLSPLVSTPMSAASQSSNLSLLDRYLIEAERLGTPISPPDELSKSALTRDFPETPVYAPFEAPIGSPIDTASEIFSPVLGDGPAERWEVEDLRDKLLRSPEPVSPTGSDETFIEDDAECSEPEPIISSEEDTTAGSEAHNAISEVPALQDEVPALGQVDASPVPTANEIVPAGDQEVKTVEAESDSLQQEQLPSPLFSRKVTGPKPSMEIRSPGHNDTIVGEAPPSAPTKDSFGIPLQVQLDSKLSPHFDPPPAPMTSTFKMTLPEFVESRGPSHFDPPPAPKLAGFPLEFPPSPKFAGPAPIDTSQSVDHWRRLTISGSPPSTMDSPTAGETHFLSLASPMAPPPAPGPSNLKFDVQLPDSPLRSKPAPIDTSAPSHANSDSNQKPLSAATMSSGTPTPRQLSEPSPAAKETTFLIAAPGKKAKTVRFALSDICKSPLPDTTFKIPVSPGFPNFSRHIPHESEFVMPEPSPELVPAVQEATPSMAANALLDLPVATDSREARSLFRKISPTFGRFARSQSEGRSVLARRHSEPQTPSVEVSRPRKASAIDEAALQDENTTNGIPILPNTIYDPQRKQFYATKNQVKSEKYIILQAYFKPNANKRRDVNLGPLDTTVGPARVADRHDGASAGDQSALPMSAESNSSESNPLWW